MNEVVNYELVTYEGFTPHQVPVIVECLTDNKNRTASAIRMLFRKGQLGSSGSVAWDFSYLGMIEAQPIKPGVDPDEAAIEAGAEDLEVNDDGTVVFYTGPTDLDVVSKALPGQGYQVQAAYLGYKPKIRCPSQILKRWRKWKLFLEAMDNGTTFRTCMPD